VQAEGSFWRRSAHAVNQDTSAGQPQQTFLHASEAAWHSLPEAERQASLISVLSICLWQRACGDPVWFAISSAASSRKTGAAAPYSETPQELLCSI
jgi:hypothetical protein